MSSHIFSLVGMVLFVNRDAFLGEWLRGPARVSFVLGDAQVTLTLLVTFSSQKLDFFLILEGLRAIRNWT